MLAQLAGEVRDTLARPASDVAAPGEVGDSFASEGERDKLGEAALALGWLGLALTGSSSAAPRKGCR